MTVRGGGIPRRPLALTPNGRMGPPLRSFTADAHDCIMVRVLASGRREREGMDAGIGAKATVLDCMGGDGEGNCASLQA